jgi:hypothetical protein
VRCESSSTTPSISTCDPSAASRPATMLTSVVLPRSSEQPRRRKSRLTLRPAESVATLQRANAEHIVSARAAAASARDGWTSSRSGRARTRWPQPRSEHRRLAFAAKQRYRQRARLGRNADNERDPPNSPRPANAGFDTGRSPQHQRQRD